MSKNKFLLAGVVSGAFIAAVTPNTLYGVVCGILVFTIGSVVAHNVEKKQS